MSKSLDYNKTLESYGLNFERDAYDLIQKKERCLLQRMPHMYLLGGLLSFMCLTTLWLLLFIVVSIIKDVDTDLFLLRNILVGIAVVSWTIIGPLLVRRIRKPNMDCGLDIKSISLFDGLLLCFDLRKQHLYMRSIRDIMDRTIQDVEKRSQYNKKLRNAQFKSLTSEQKELLSVVDEKLKYAINSQYAIMHMFSDYLSIDKFKTMIEAGLCGMCVLLLYSFPYFAPHNVSTNIWELLIPFMVGLSIPYICLVIKYVLIKKAYLHVIKQEDSPFNAKSKYHQIHEATEEALMNAERLYVLQLVNILEENIVSNKRHSEAENDECLSLINQIQNYVPVNDQEESDKDAMLQFLKCFDNALSRENVFGHFCASAFVLSADGTKALMLHHNIMNDYIYPGGHADEVEDLYSVALREVEEETGLVVKPIYGHNIFAIQAAPVKGHYKNGKWVPAHIHYDVLFLFQANAEDMDKIRVCESENSVVQWRELSHVADDDVAPWAQPVMRKIAEKLTSI